MIINERIRDIPTLRALSETAHAVSKFEQEFPRQKDRLQNLGVDVVRLEALFENSDIDDLTRRVEHLRTLPDRFNDALGPQGWIIYEDLRLDVAEAAVKHAETGDLAAAEAELVSYYDVETVEWHLQQLTEVDAFRPRLELAEKALADYEAGRYHACVPVVLAILDGMVQQAYIDTYGENRGFSTEEADLKAWNSIAAHSTGLEYLQDLMLQGRQTTRTKEIDKPYRNGIMHGMDLGYATERVAAKTWATLFAAGEWAKRAENGELGESTDAAVEQSVLEALRVASEQYEETQETRRAIDSWEPRDVIVSGDVPVAGDPDDYNEETPERALVEFLSYWADGNYGGMADALITSDGSTEHPRDLRDEFDHLDLQSFELVEIEGVAPAQRRITVAVKVERFGERIREERSVVMTRIGADGQAAIPEHEEGNWTVTNRVVLTAL